VILLATLLACAGDPADSVRDSGPCADAPLVTWETFGQGFLVENCQACHAQGVTDRAGAPQEVSFGTEEEALRWKDRILARAAGESPTMPPMGGTTADDRWRLEVWLTCHAP